MNLFIRSLKTDDYETVVKIWRAAGLEFRPHGRDSRENLEKFIADNPDLCLCAESGGAIIGVILGSDDGRKAWINRVAVPPEFQKKGVASRLIVELESAFKKRGRRVFSALIYDDNDSSAALFEQAGFSHATNVRYFSKRETPDS